MKFEPTHELKTDEGEIIRVMLLGDCAYQGHEWADCMAASITNDGSWKKNGKPFMVEAKKAESEIEPDDLR